MMHYQLDKQRSESAYMQIYRQLREEIISGTLKAGTKLPSKRALAEELNVSIITVEHAYALLIDETSGEQVISVISLEEATGISPDGITVTDGLYDSLLREEADYVREKD